LRRRTDNPGDDVAKLWVTLVLFDAPAIRKVFVKVKQSVVEPA
jgi:hypothetical protein